MCIILTCSLIERRESHMHLHLCSANIKLLCVTSALFYSCQIFLLQWLHFTAVLIQAHPNVNHAKFPTFCPTMEIIRCSRHEKGKVRYTKDIMTQKQWGQKERKTLFWQPLQASLSVTLITIQLWEIGYSIRHSGTLPGSCSTVGWARPPPLSQVHAFGLISCPTYATV